MTHERPSLPPGLARPTAEVTDPDALEEAALAMHTAAASAILDGVRAHGHAFVADAVRRILDAWARCSDQDRVRAERAVAAHADAAVNEVVEALAALFALDPEAQRATPLEIVRRLVTLPTEILREVGVPPVVRDAHAERIAPDDDYGLEPADLADLGDPELRPLMLAWGLAKANVIRARRARGPFTRP
jgi:hypothetical protein